MTAVATAFVGCKVSQADADRALADLRAAGARPTERDDADLVVVYTCCVTREAERKSRQLVNRMARDGKRVMVAGCAATLAPEQFAGPGVEVVDQERWATVLGQVGQATADDAPPGAQDAHPARRTRLVLKAQDGCDGACTYCAVRLARGRARSTPLGDVLALARAGLAGGCGEVVLSGIDLGAWRDGGLRLPDLVTAVAGLPGLARVRLSSLEPRHVDDALAAAFASPAVACHLHVPLQSADDEVLAAMGRPYDLETFVAAVSRFRGLVPGVSLTTDVIVGFPSESEAAFARTLRVLEGGLFGRAHVFAFSPRPGTLAAGLAPLPAAVVKERMGRALAAAADAARRARRAALGRTLEVLVEDRRDGMFRGYSSEYVRCVIDGPHAALARRGVRPGTMVLVAAREEYDDGVRGSIR